MNKTLSKIEAVPTIAKTDPQLFRKRIDAINQSGVVGERENIATVCATIDSRLILPDSSGQQGLGLKISGTQGTGKSYVVESSLKLQDQSGYHSISNASDKSFFYLSKSMKNKALILAEGAKLQRDSEFGYVVRSLLSEGKAIHQVTAQKGRGNHQTIMKVVEGPVSLITTTTCATLEKQIESRLITVSPDESSKQTRAIMKRAAELASKGVTDKDQNLIQAWQKFHKDLKPARVVIPFAPKIERQMNKQTQLVPMLARRSFKHFLSLIRAIAIFYQAQRKKNESGEIKAEIADFHIAYQILSEIFEEKMDIGNETDQERIEFIVKSKKLLQIKDLTKEWGISKQAVSKWLKPKLKDGIVEWCDATGQRFKTEADTRKAKRSGTAHLQKFTNSQQKSTNSQQKFTKSKQNPQIGMFLPTAFELTQDKQWDIKSENAKLYDLRLNLT